MLRATLTELLSAEHSSFSGTLGTIFSVGCFAFSGSVPAWKQVSTDRSMAGRHSVCRNDFNYRITGIRIRHTHVVIFRCLVDAAPNVG